MIYKATTGYVVLRPAENPTEVLIMNTADINTATKIWRWNMNGFGYSSTGINGTYGTAITMDGAIVADFITAGILSANLIKAGTMSLNRLFGDDLVLGGNNNRSGRLVIKDSNAVEKMIADAEGLRLINGSKLFGSDGVLSNFKYDGVSNYKSFLGYYDWLDVNTKSQITIDAYIPNNFVITAANVIMIHNPVNYIDYKNNPFWGYCRNIKLYKTTNQNFPRMAYIGSEYYDIIEDQYLVEVQNGFGTNGFTGTVASSANTNQEIVISTDVKNYLQSGQNTLVLQTANNPPTFVDDSINKNAWIQTGRVRAILNVVGYIK